MLNRKLLIEERDRVKRLYEALDALLAVMTHEVDENGRLSEALKSKRKKSITNQFPDSGKKTRGQACCGSKSNRHKKNCANSSAAAPHEEVAPIVQVGRARKYACIDCEEDITSTLPFEEVKCPKNTGHTMVEK